MVKIHDVAKRAGVSISTVSLVVNESPLVKRETREHVEQVIRELGYVPNHDARSLRSRVTNNLGIIYLSASEGEMFRTGYDDDHTAGLTSMSIVSGIMKGIMDTQYGVVSEYFCADGSMGELPQIVRGKRVDGVFLVASPFAGALAKQLKRVKMPFVMVGVDSQAEGVDAYYFNSREAVFLALEHLAQMGHRRICLVNSAEVFLSSGVRRSAFLEKAQELGLELDEPWEIVCAENCGRSSYEAFGAYWRAGSRPDGIVAGNGYMALGVMRYLYEQQLRVPEEVSIVSCEDTVLSGYAVPPLTSVNIGKEALGYKAARGLMDRICAPEHPPVQVTQPPRLICRGSVLDRRGGREKMGCVFRQEGI